LGSVGGIGGRKGGLKEKNREKTSPLKEVEAEFLSKKEGGKIVTAGRDGTEVAVSR